VTALLFMAYVGVDKGVSEEMDSDSKSIAKREVVVEIVWNLRLICRALNTVVAWQHFLFVVKAHNFGAAGTITAMLHDEKTLMQLAIIFNY
jgi:hypothetical protein